MILRQLNSYEIVFLLTWCSYLFLKNTFLKLQKRKIIYSVWTLPFIAMISMNQIL